MKMGQQEDQQEKYATSNEHNNDNSVAYSNYSDGYIRRLKETIGQFKRVKNHGATCYLNALLQSLHFTPEFREGIIIEMKKN